MKSRPMAEAHLQSSTLGSILGTAIGDSIGLPYEGLSRRRAERLLGPADRHRFFSGVAWSRTIRSTPAWWLSP